LRVGFRDAEQDQHPRPYFPDHCLANAHLSAAHALNDGSHGLFQELFRILSPLMYGLS
jgi:hypothetical protein